MENNLKALFETRSPPPDSREEVYDSFNEETFGTMETWEEGEFESGSTLTISNGAETDGDSASLKEKEADDSVEEVSGRCSRRAGVDDNDQEKDNMAFLIDSTLSHLGLDFTMQKQDGSSCGALKKLYGNRQSATEELEGLAGREMGDSLEQLPPDTEENEWTIGKQKSEENYRENISRSSLHQQRSVIDADDGPAPQRESVHQISFERGDADRVVVGGTAPLVSPRRGSGRFDGGRAERGNGHYCRRFSGPNAPSHGGSGGTGQSGNAISIRPENFDLRNVETFGIEAVQQHIHDHHPNNTNSNSSGAPSSTNNNSSSNSNNTNAPNSGVNNNSSDCKWDGNGTSGGGGGGGGQQHSGHASIAAATNPVTRTSRSCSRYDPDGSSTNPANFGGERGDSRARLPEIRDPRMYDFYMELWQRMQQQAAAEESNSIMNNSSSSSSGISGVHSHLGASNNSGNSSHNTSSSSGNHYNINGGIGDSRLAGGPRRSIDQRTGDVHFETQMTELKHKVWEQLELAADLGPVIDIMEDVFDRLVDPTEPPSAEDRLKALRKLADNVLPDNVCNLVRLVHSRRLVMYTLAHLWSEVSLRDHVLELVSIMLRRLDTLLVSDGSDMVFAQKQQVFARIFHGCTMEQLVSLTTCLLKAPAMAVESKLGLFFIGRILECAEDSELNRLPAHWVEKCLPKLLQHLARVPRAEIVHELVGARAVEHMIRNMDGVSFMRAVHAANPNSYP
ncbi:uncharacterized protein LOC111245156 isoform X1 [Varroa destructor]|uniref:Uncharacterized protein n=1 Tax=Varroa destructor TaxID=109461 RepID=A0A7M7JNE7_VARDE|nr:uncharacterized protein LOC111245156 isoform X1 [Varroa destructor]XP_022648848.1 uncharacterized protein LOC111245156 isoform X1 [Varroa destructor]XP_022648849.1 uncharacterized protein LOC111245156 isoform X1 [Varroa destructor]